MDAGKVAPPSTRSQLTVSSVIKLPNMTVPFEAAAKTTTQTK